MKRDFADQDVTFVAVNIWDEPERALEFVEGQTYGYRWARADEASIERLGIATLPSLVVLDRDGRVAWRSSLMTLARQGGDLRDVLEGLTGG